MPPFSRVGCIRVPRQLGRAAFMEPFPTPTRRVAFVAPFAHRGMRIADGGDVRRQATCKNRLPSPYLLAFDTTDAGGISSGHSRAGVRRWLPSPWMRCLPAPPCLSGRLHYSATGSAFDAWYLGQVRYAALLFFFCRIAATQTPPSLAITCRPAVALLLAFKLRWHYRAPFIPAWRHLACPVRSWRSAACGGAHSLPARCKLRHKYGRLWTLLDPSCALLALPVRLYGLYGR